VQRLGDSTGAVGLEQMINGRCPDPNCMAINPPQREITSRHLWRIPEPETTRLRLAVPKAMYCTACRCVYLPGGFPQLVGRLDPDEFGPYWISLRV
jgi:hypothetical protein